MKMLVCTLLVVSLLFGCTSGHLLYSSDDKALEVKPLESSKRWLEIVLKDGTSFHMIATSFDYSKNILHGYNGKTEIAVDISKVEFVERRKFSFVKTTSLIVLGVPVGLCVLLSLFPQR